MYKGEKHLHVHQLRFSHWILQSTIHTLSMTWFFELHKLTDLLISCIDLNWLHMIWSQQFTSIVVDIINLALDSHWQVVNCNLFRYIDDKYLAPQTCNHILSYIYKTTDMANKSAAFDHFIVPANAQGNYKAQCKQCAMKISSCSGATTNLLKHMKVMYFM